jgi:1,4-alpha-glucan branching enzyme
VFGGRENLEAVQFLKTVNTLIHEEAPGAFSVAEESTAWFGVTQSPAQGGLGFDFKWNMGWMHDTLDFFEQDPINRKYRVDQLTFSMVYEYTERFINATSHDEVVYGKRSLLEKMPGDDWQKRANLRLFLAYQYTRPGKKLLFMGTEFAQQHEWNFDTSLDWHVAAQPDRQAIQTYTAELGQLYAATAALWREDPDPSGFEWVDCTDRERTVISYLRKEGASHVLVVLNFTPVCRENYRIGVPCNQAYRSLLCTDDVRFGGSGVGAGVFESEAQPWHGKPRSLVLTLPPLGALILAPIA